MPTAASMIAFALISLGIRNRDRVRLFLGRRPSFAVAQRRLMGTVLAGLGVRMATEARR